MIATELTPQAIENAVRHMNDDHQQSVLAYAQVLGGFTWAETAVITQIDAQGFTIQVRGHGREETQRLSFPKPVENSQALRMAFIALADQADQPDGKPHIALARVKTAKASRYLKALCNHFNRKVTASYDDNIGRVHFPFGDCTLQAEAETLVIHVSAASAMTLTRTKHVVADHLVRFGEKDELTVTWVDEVS